MKVIPSEWTKLFDMHVLDAQVHNSLGVSISRATPAQQKDAPLGFIVFVCEDGDPLKGTHYFHESFIDAVQHYLKNVVPEEEK